MISYDKNIGDKGIVSIDMTTEAFGSKAGRDGKPGPTYTEGPWFYKRNSLYYMVYAAEGIPEYISYSTSNSPEGPWTYKGHIMKRADHLAFTNHSGIIDFKGNSYIFYHDQSLSKGQGFKRSVSVEQFAYNADGSIPVIPATKEGVIKSVANLDPYKRVEAETIAWSEGLKTSGNSQNGVYVTKISNGDYIKVRSVDLGKGAKTFEASVASAASGGTIEIRIDGKDSQLLGSLNFSATGGDQSWKTLSCKLEKATGIHDVYFVFKGGKGNLFNFDWWKFGK